MGEGDDEVSVQAYRPTRWWELWNWPQDTKGGGASSSSGLTVPAPDSALSPEQSGGGPQSQGVGRGGCSCRKAASLWVGISALG